MDASALPSIKEFLSDPILKDYLSNNHPDHVSYPELLVEELIKIETFMKRRSNPGEEEQVLLEDLQIAHTIIVKYMREDEPDSGIFVSFLELIAGMVVSCNYWKQRETEQWLRHKELVAIINSLNEKDIIENLLLDKADCNSNLLTTPPNINEEEKRVHALALLLVKTFPALLQLKEHSEIFYFLLDSTKEIGNLPQLICEACEGEPLFLVLIGGLLSLKQCDYHTWNKVKDDLVKIKESDNAATNRTNLGPMPIGLKVSSMGSMTIQSALRFAPTAFASPVKFMRTNLKVDRTVPKPIGPKFESDGDRTQAVLATNNYMQCMVTYCINDLPHFLKRCFLYLACYPIGYEIPATSLTQLWIAEDFVTPQQGETIEDTSHNYLEQLVKRSLVCVSNRSLLGTIKYCRVHRSIHELVIQRSNLNNFLATNPSRVESLSGITMRLAVHNDYRASDWFLGHKLQSIFAFDSSCSLHSTHSTNALALKVLELRKCSTQFRKLLDGSSALRYIGLRGTYICDIPEEAFFMRTLKTLDIRDTGIDILPEKIWNIPKLRHVYVNSGPNIKGPPSKAYLPDLQTLKTVGIHESWLENFPQCLINLRKLALLNRDNSYWKPISNLLSHMVNLLSMTIIGDIVPSEFVDVRAFPNLETVRSIKFEGEWKYCKKLIIDNVKFPTNLTKLTLKKSGLREDPMPRLERLEALKFLSLQDGAYTGNKMVCSENGFPQLQFLELKKLEKLEDWEVNPRAMPQLTKLYVVECPALKNFPDKLGLVTEVCININENVCWDFMI